MRKWWEKNKKSFLLLVLSIVSTEISANPARFLSRGLTGSRGVIRRAFIKKFWFESVWPKVDQSSFVLGTRFKLAQSLRWVNKNCSWIRHNYPSVKEVSNELYRLSGHYRYPTPHIGDIEEPEVENGTDFAVAFDDDCFESDPEGCDVDCDGDI